MRTFIVLLLHFVISSDKFREHLASERYGQLGAQPNSLDHHTSSGIHMNISTTRD